MAFALLVCNSHGVLLTLFKLTSLWSNYSTPKVRCLDGSFDEEDCLSPKSLYIAIVLHVFSWYS